MRKYSWPITIIAAVAENQIIGKDGKLPWDIPEELQHFKKSTLCKPIIMGKATWESLGRPLPKRQNIVISSTMKSVPGVSVARSIDDALEIADAYLAGFLEGCAGKDFEPEIMIIGGANVYDQFLPKADYLLLTRVKQMPEGDTLFPAYDTTEWERQWVEDHPLYAIEKWKRLIVKPDDKRFENVLWGTQDASK